MACQWNSLKTLSSCMPANALSKQHTIRIRSTEKVQTYYKLVILYTILLQSRYGHNRRCLQHIIICSNSIITVTNVNFLTPTICAHTYVALLAMYSQ